MAAASKMPMDKRPDFDRVLAVAAWYTTLSGMLNGFALSELGAPIGYTSGACVNAGRLMGAGDPALKNILGICVSYIFGGFLAGAGGTLSDGDAVFEGRQSPGMLLASVLLLLGAYAKKNLGRPWLACQIWALSQGITNAVATRCSSGPIRATHTGGGQTDAGILLGMYARGWYECRPVPMLRKVVLNMTCTVGMIVGGLLSQKIYSKHGKQYGAWLGAIPAGMLALSATVVPVMIAHMNEHKEEEEKTSKSTA